MCYSIPGKIIQIKENLAVVDYFGEKRVVLNEGDFSIGDYVYAQGGVILQKVETKIAENILESWKEDFEKLKEIDKGISSEIEIQNDDVKILCEKVLYESDKESAVKLLALDKKEDLDFLFKYSNKVRFENHSNSSCVHGIIEFSNYCRNDCLYCGIRKSNKNLRRYRMSKDEILKTAKYAIEELNFKALVLQSGEDSSYSKEEIIEIIKGIIKEHNVLIFLSIGNRPLEEYKDFYEAGARGILMRFESSNKKIYSEIHEGVKTDYEGRIKLIKGLKKMGFIVASGFLIGLPNQTDSDLIEDIIFTKSLGVDMYSFGPVIPSFDTPLKDLKKVSLEKVLKVISLNRLIDRTGVILVTTALETLNPRGRNSGLLSGANSLMINVTPENNRLEYSIYPGKDAGMDSVEEKIKRTIKELYSIGRAPTDIGIK